MTVVFSFGDPQSGVHGSVRAGHGEAVAVLCAGGAPVLAGPSRVAVEDAEAGRRWRVEAGDGEAGVTLDFEATAEPVDLAAGELTRREQVCRVTGTARLAGAEREVSCLGSRAESPATGDGRRFGSRRALAAWLGEDRALLLAAERAGKAKGHADDPIAAWLIGGDRPADPVAPERKGAVAVAEPRLSTTYDGEGRPLRTGVELWVTGADEEIPRRAAAEAVCAVTVPLDGGLRLDCAFLAWHMEGHEGAGVYELVRRA